MAQKRAAATQPADLPAKKKRPEDVDDVMAVYHGAYGALHPLRKEIRILRVEPGPTNEPVSCTFEPAFLDGGLVPHYETVSYVWGDASKRAMVLLHEQPCDVPASSEEVLRRMRDPKKIRRLWIDAICINQNDLQERGQQVAIMGQIYSSGINNLIWLGTGDGTTLQAIASIKMINKEMHAATRDVGALKDIFYPGGTIVDSGTGLQARVRESALRRFFESPWFERYWVVQEAALSPHSICFRGDHEIGLMEIMQAALWIRYKAGCGVAQRLCESGVLYAAISLADWTVANGGYHLSRPLHGRTLAALLASFHALQAKDPRDRVFALSGLWLVRSGAAELPSDLTPDYYAPLSDVLTRAMRFAFRERGDLEILKLISHQPDGERLPGLPTWVHRWDATSDVHGDPTGLTHHDRRADANIPPDMDQILHDDRILTVRGFTVGSVTTHLSEPRKRQSRSVRKFLDAVEHSVRQVHKGDEKTLHQMVGMTLQAGITSTSQPADEQDSGQAYEIYRRALANFDSAYPYHNVNLAKMSAVAQKQVAAQFAQAMFTACHDRRFFSATGGRFGIGPKTTQKGDLVVILYGSPFPVVLRPFRKHGDDCELVGVCYVYGIMEGEAVQEHKRHEGVDALYRVC